KVRGSVFGSSSDRIEWPDAGVRTHALGRARVARRDWQPNVHSPRVAFRDASGRVDKQTGGNLSCWPGRMSRSALNLGLSVPLCGVRNRFSENTQTSHEGHLVSNVCDCSNSMALAVNSYVARNVS